MSFELVSTSVSGGTYSSATTVTPDNSGSFSSQSVTFSGVAGDTYHLRSFQHGTTNNPTTSTTIVKLTETSATFNVPGA